MSAGRRIVLGNGILCRPLELELACDEVDGVGDVAAKRQECCDRCDRDHGEHDPVFGHRLAALLAERNRLTVDATEEVANHFLSPRFEWFFRSGVARCEGGLSASPPSRALAAQPPLIWLAT